MWSVKLGGTIETKHRIELKIESFSKHQIAYRQGMEMFEAANKKIIQQIYHGLLEPYTS